MIYQVQGDLLESNVQYICHQCNCVSTGSAHLAYDIFKKFPYSNVYEHRSYPHTPLTGEEPGDIIIRGDGEKERYVIALMAQYFPGHPKYSDGKLDGYLARQTYFATCLTKISEIPNLESIAFPWGIGCGAAGGNWNTYLQMLENFDKSINAKTVVYKFEI